MSPADAPRRSWTEGPSILAVLRAWDGRGPVALPDDPAPGDGSRIRFASGALDGIRTHHALAGSRNAAVDVVESVLFSVERLVRTGNDHARVALYDLVMGDSAVAHADAIVERLVEQRRFPLQSLRPHARWLVREAAHREPLKLGVVLLGVCGDDADLEELELLARHDEFTLYALVAAAQIVDDPRDVWWRMAGRVRGWGKIHVVERLARQVEDRPDIQAWLLRHGCDNDVMPEYLAYPCAVAGRLAEALAVPPVDDELLDGACLIVRALLAGGPAEDVDGYPDAPSAIARLLDHLATRCDRIERLEAARAVLDWLEWPAASAPARRAHVYGESWAVTDGDRAHDASVWAERAELGWTEETRARLATRAAAILGAPEWPGRVRALYHDGDARARGLAWRIAPSLGLDLWEDAFARLERDPLDAGLYGQLLHTDDAARLTRVLRLAESSLPLAAIASGPAREHGWGAAFRAHHCVDFLVQEMRRDGVWSVPLVAAALRSPLVRNRNLAVATLAARPRAGWEPELRALLERTLDDDPDEKLRERIAALLAP